MLKEKDTMRNSNSELFMVEEYKNIANTHDKLRDSLSLIFNYFLIISAIPFTLLGFNASSPNYFFESFMIPLFFVLVSTGNMFLALSMYSARLSQYRYARVVNLIRKYFCDQDNNLEEYLYLPTTDQKPRLENPGYIKYQIIYMIVVSAIYMIVGLVGFRFLFVYCFLVIVVYILIFAYLFIEIYKRFKKEKVVSC